MLNWKSARVRCIRAFAAMAMGAALAISGAAGVYAQADTTGSALKSLDKRVPASRAQAQLSFAPIVKRAAPAVVNVYSKRIVKNRGVSPFFRDFPFPEFFGRSFRIPRQRVQRSLGSGVIVRPNGVIVTNNHVIRGGTEIQVVLSDGREFEADIVLSDEKTDLAVLKVNPRGERLPFLKFSDSDDLEVGDLVLAIGNPFGVGQTVTSGIVSALARTQAGISDFQFFIQTDAAINPGNSGGALINMNGELAGINTAIFSRSGGSNGIGFAIPANMVRVVVRSSRVGGRVKRPWLGVSLQNVTPELAESFRLPRPRGALITGLRPKGPLARAGLRTGDVIVEVDGKPVQSPQELRYRIATKALGGRAMLGYFRNGRKNAAAMPLMEAPEIPPRNISKLVGPHPLSGITVANLSPALVEEIGFKGRANGVIVLSPGRGAARFNNIRSGDIIVELEGTRIHRVDDLRRMLRRQRNRWNIVIIRNGERISGTLSG